MMANLSIRNSADLSGLMRGQKFTDLHTSNCHVTLEQCIKAVRRTTCTVTLPCSAKYS